MNSLWECILLMCFLFLLWEKKYSKLNWSTMNVKTDVLESNNCYEHWGIIKIICNFFLNLKKPNCMWIYIFFLLNSGYLKWFGRQKFLCCRYLWPPCPKIDLIASDFVFYTGFKHTYSVSVYLSLYSMGFLACVKRTKNKIEININILLQTLG